MNRITQYFPIDELFAEEEVDEARLLAFDGRDRDPDGGLQLLPNRHFDPTLGKWLDDCPTGYAGGDDHLHPYVGQ